MRLVRMVRKGLGGLEMIEVLPSEVENKKAENWAVIKVRDGEDPLEIYRRGRQAAEKPVPPPVPPSDDTPPAEIGPAEILATKSEEELKIIAKEYGIEHPEAGKDDLILDILTKAGYQVERVGKDGQAEKESGADKIEPKPAEEAAAQETTNEQETPATSKDLDPAATEAPAPAESSAATPESSEPPKE